MIFNSTEKKFLPQILAAIAAVLFGISDGMAFGWTAPFLPYLISEESHIRTTQEEAEWLEPAFLCGSFAGLPLTILLVTKCGRKNSLLIAAAMDMVAWIITGLGNTMWYLFIARFLFGAAENICLISGPMYMTEIADQRIRGMLTATIYIMVQVGILVVYSIGPFTPYYVTPLVGALIALVGVVVFHFLPETPYYLMSEDQHEAARRSMVFFKSYSDVDKEIVDITDTLKREKALKGGWRDLLLIPSNRKAVIIVLFLNIGIHMSAYSSILMNLHSILDSAGSMYMESSQAAILFAIVMLVSVILCSVQVDNCGRKVLLMISSVALALCLFTLAIYFHLKNDGYDVLRVSWIPLVSVMIYAAFFKFGVGTVPIILSSEILAMGVKPLGMVSGDFVYTISGMLVLKLYQSLSDKIHISFYIFGAWSCITALFNHFFILETKGKSLEEIQLMFKGGCRQKGSIWNA